MATYKTYTYTRGDLEKLAGMTKAGISQHIIRGNLVVDDLVSVTAFLARYGTPTVRMEILTRMMGFDRQAMERARPQSTRNVRRDTEGRVVHAEAHPGQGVNRVREQTKK